MYVYITNLCVYVYMYTCLYVCMSSLYILLAHFFLLASRRHVGDGSEGRVEEAARAGRARGRREVAGGDDVGRAVVAAAAREPVVGDLVLQQVRAVLHRSSPTITIIASRSSSSSVIIVIIVIVIIVIIVIIIVIVIG